MSTISSTQEAYEALCAGELFQVGGRFINPGDVVEVDPNGGQNPIFYLVDGRTVQHDRFRQGDVGDYLADALQYATRGQAQSQAIKPAFNTALVDNALLNEEYTQTASTPISGDAMSIRYSSNHVFSVFQDGSNADKFVRKDIGGGNEVTKAIASTSDIRGIVAKETEAKVYYTLCPDDTTFEIYEANLDFSSSTKLQTGAIPSGGTNEVTMSMAVDEEAGQVFALSFEEDGHAGLFKMAEDGSSLSDLGQVIVAFKYESFDLGVDEENQIIYVGGPQRGVVGVDYTGAQKYSQDAPFNVSGVGHIDGTTILINTTQANLYEVDMTDGSSEKVGSKTKGFVDLKFDPSSA